MRVAHCVLVEALTKEMNISLSLVFMLQHHFHSSKRSEKINAMNVGGMFPLKRAEKDFC